LKLGCKATVAQRWRLSVVVGLGTHNLQEAGLLRGAVALGSRRQRWASGGGAAHVKQRS